MIAPAESRWSIIVSDSSDQLQCYSRLSCSNTARRCLSRPIAEPRRVWRRLLQAVSGCRLGQNISSGTRHGEKTSLSIIPECVIFKRAPVAFLCTRISLDLASFVSGPKAPDLAILALFSSCVARFVMHPTALHCTSTFFDDICRMSGGRPPSCTIATLFSAATSQCEAMQDA